ncbi:MAG: PVC-type heme-binding CxxCH protein [Verrucomicrobiota bacterium]
MKILPVCAVLLFPLSPTMANEPTVAKSEFPPTPATEPEDALSTFEVAQGFHLRLVAHEPEVCDPIAMAFDEQGRAWVVEMRGYSERREEALGRVRLLEDTTGDGFFDRSIVFKDGLKWPTAILPYRDGVFVGATPDLFFFRDTDGDGVSDHERVVFTGFGGGKLKLNMQALFNSFRWGPDNRVWGATAANGGTVTRPDDPAFGPVSLRGSDFSFDPEALDLRPENGTAQYGMSFDSFGRRFVCSNSRHLIWVAYERSQAPSNRWYSPPPALVDIPDDGAAAPVFRISPDEPWRVVRTRWRVAGVVKGIVEGGGRVSGYFTSATGVHLYWGNTFGDEFRNNAFIGDVGSNLVHRKVIRHRENSLGLVASRSDPDEKTEFLRSRDNWFRPTSFATGPDGCLYITDMYRETIEHPWSLPEPIKRHLDLNSGWDRGRIYRVEPAAFTKPEIPNLSHASTAELRSLTNHPADWHRTSARRLLYQLGEEVDSPARPAGIFSDPPSLPLDEQTLAEIEGDDWTRTAFLSTLDTLEKLRTAWKGRTLAESRLSAALAKMAGRTGEPETLETFSSDLDTLPLSPELADAIVALFEGVESHPDPETRKAVVSLLRKPESWSRLRGELAGEGLFEDILRRRAAFRLLSLIDPTGAQEQFELLFSQHLDDPAFLEDIVPHLADLPLLAKSFSLLPPSLRDLVGPRILASSEASKVLLQSVKSGTVSLSDLAASMLEGLRNHGDKEVNELAKANLPQVLSRIDVIEQYRPALDRTGNPSNGKYVFARACLTCHRTSEGEGIELGPDVTTFAAIGGESLLERILDPNREVAPQYQAYNFNRKDGSSLTGVIRSETPEAVHLRMPGGLEETFRRSEVISMKSLGRSLMPDGLEAAISVAEMADLLAYLSASSTAQQ